MASKKRRHSDKDASSARKKQQSHSPSDERCDPKSRGIHPDAIQAQAKAASGRATCIACHALIKKGEPRWGIKYAGNPLPIPVIPLYGSHPMCMWCHAGGCGLSFQRLSDEMMSDAAAKMCHACQDSPSVEEDGGLRLLCGASPNKQGKIQQHAFHMSCWLGAIDQVKDEEAKKQLLVSPADIEARHGGLSWNDLTKEEQAVVQEKWNEYSA